MKGKLLANLVLALVVLGLALWMTLKPGGEAAPGTRLSQLTPDQVKVVRIARRDLPEFVLERQGKGWVQTAPFPARTDPARTGRLLDLLRAESARQLPAEDLARFELDPPQVRVTLGTQVFDFGAENPITNEMYVLTGGKVHLVAPVYAYGLPSRADGFATHMLLAEDEVPVRLALPGVTLEFKDGKWATDPAPAEKPSQDDLQRWVEQWRFASSVATQRVTDTPKGEPVTIGLKGGRTLSMVVVKRAPELVIARPDEQLLFVFPAETAAGLFSAPKSGR